MLTFYWKEVLKSLSRAKMSAFISLLTSCIAVLLIAVSFILLGFSKIIEEKIKDKVSLDLFLQDNISRIEVENLLSSIKQLNYVSRLEYKDKNQAREEFIKETGEDFQDILDINPLPQSIEVKLKPEYIQTDSLTAINLKLAHFPGVEEVVFQSSFVYKVLSVMHSARLQILIASLILILISLYIVFSTNRLIIQARLAEIETMKLVGAKLWTIKAPILLNGVLIGLVSSVISVIVFKSLVFLLASNLDNSLIYFSSDIRIYLSILVSGPVIGLLGSLMASKKITLKVQKFIF